MDVILWEVKKGKIYIRKEDGCGKVTKSDRYSNNKGQIICSPGNPVKIPFQNWKKDIKYKQSIYFIISIIKKLYILLIKI